MTTASIASADFQKGARRPKVAIYEPYVFNTVYGNARYTSMYFKFIDKTQFSPILISPVECEFLETLGKRGEEWQVVPGPGPLNEFGGKTLTNGLLGNQARYRARRLAVHPVEQRGFLVQTDVQENGRTAAGRGEAMAQLLLDGAAIQGFACRSRV